MFCVFSLRFLSSGFFVYVGSDNSESTTVVHNVWTLNNLLENNVDLTADAKADLNLHRTHMSAGFNERLDYSVRWRHN